MGFVVDRSAARYRLIYVQPEPETGERICVGLVFEEPTNRASVIFDNDFTKLRCVAPKIDVELLRFYAEDLRRAIESGKDLDAALARYAPQFLTSPDRAVTSPVTETIKLRLLQRFAGGKETRTDIAGIRIRVADTITAFVTGIAPRDATRIIERATPEQILGRHAPLIDPVSTAVIGPHGLVLIDGVDLHEATPKRSINLANKVVHTFWEYGRLSSDHLIGKGQPFKRVGIVMNGVARTRTMTARHRELYRNAHDYAIAQFKKEADITVDTGSIDDTETLRSVLASTV